MRPCRQLTCGRYSGQKCFSSKSPLCRIKKVCGGRDLRNVGPYRYQFRPVPEPSQVKSRPRGCLSHGRLTFIAFTCQTLTAREDQVFFLPLGLAPRRASIFRSRCARVFITCSAKNGVSFTSD